MINSIKKKFYNDILIVLYDRTQSVIETKKLNQLLQVKENIQYKIKQFKDLKVVEIEVNNLSNLNDEKKDTRQVCCCFYDVVVVYHKDFV